MIIALVCCLIFLFTVYKIAKEDFIFIRKNITLEEIFNTVFIALPVALLTARILFIISHPSIRYLNPLIFFAIPYFPGLSLAGGIFGIWISVKIYLARKEMHVGRILDVFGVAFLLSVSIGIFLVGLSTFFTNKLVGLEETGRFMLGIAFFLFCLSQFIKNNWQEGSIAYLSVVFYSILTFISAGFMLLSHKNVSLPQQIITIILFGISFFLFIFKTNPLGKLVRK